jgi:hypothetical protein
MGDDGSRNPDNEDRGAGPPAPSTEGAPVSLSTAISDVAASAAQWHFRIDELIAHLDTVEDTIDFLPDQESRLTLRRNLRTKRSQLRDAGRQLTQQVRTLSRFAAVRGEPQ